MSTISPTYSSEDSSNEDFIETPIHTIKLSNSTNNLDLLIDKKMSRIIFKIKKYYMICI